MLDSVGNNERLPLIDAEAQDDGGPSECAGMKFQRVSFKFPRYVLFALFSFVFLFPSVCASEIWVCGDQTFIEVPDGELPPSVSECRTLSSSVTCGGSNVRYVSPHGATGRVLTEECRSPKAGSSVQAKPPARKEKPTQGRELDSLNPKQVGQDVKRLYENIGKAVESVRKGL